MPENKGKAMRDMVDKTIAKHRVADFIRDLMQESDVIAPTVADAGQTAFRPVTLAEDVVWDGGHTTVPPTSFLLPQSETMFRYEQRGSDVSLMYQLDETRRTIVGIKPCDVHSIRMLDDVFTGQYADPYYLSRRKNTMLIALMCREPEASCFCSSFGTGPDLGADSGADLLLADLGDIYYVRVFSERGQECVNRSGAIFADATESDRQAVAEASAAAERKISRHLDMEGLPEALGAMFDSPYWKKIAQKCLSCGACTYLCPVCYCFDVADTCTAASGERTRCWDACTFKSFAMLSGGHNPRPSIAEGYRQKMYHKFSFAPERHGYALCVGCGRCLDACPVNMDIVRVLTDAKAAAQAKGVV